MFFYQVLQESFYSCQYPSQETIKTIASVITSTQQKVESWFLISRVIADILDPSANDTKEMVRQVLNLYLIGKYIAVAVV